MRRTEMGVQDMHNRRARSRGTDCRGFGATPTGMDALATALDKYDKKKLSSHGLLYLFLL